MINPQRVDFVTLRLLLAVASTGSITKAAQSLHLALGAASTRIRDLEDRMGLPLGAACTGRALYRGRKRGPASCPLH